MAQHLTEQQLIEYQFDLAEESARASIGEHLAGCGRCTAALEAIAGRFSALDLVAEEMGASEELIAAVVGGAKSAEMSHIAHVNRWKWALAAAAMIAVAVGVLMLPGDKPSGPGDGSGGYAKVTDGGVEFTRRMADGKQGGVSSPAPGKPTDMGLDPGGVMVSADDPTHGVYVKGLEELGQSTTVVAKDFAIDGDADAAVDEGLMRPYQRGSERENMKAGSEVALDLTAVEGSRRSASFGESERWYDAGRNSGLVGVGLGNYGGMGGYAGMGGGLGGDVFGKAPFAPASAIELVVLPRRDKVQLTIYNSADLTLVREQRNLTLKRGWNWLQFMWADTMIDPTSLTLEPLAQQGAVDIQQLVYPARLNRIGRWLVRSEVDGQVPFEIMYLTGGLSWQSFYMGTLSRDESRMEFKNYVRVSNLSGEDYENAQTRLIVGKVHLLDDMVQLSNREFPYGRPGSLVAIGQAGLDTRKVLWGGENDFSTPEAVVVDEFTTQYRTWWAGDRPKEIKKEGLSEYFLYTIAGTETIENTWSKRLLSFEASDVNVASLYKYDEERYGGQAFRFVSFANDEDHNLGETPLPNGDVRIFGQADENGSLSYVGRTAVKYIPVDEDVELNLGPARLVKVEPKLMQFDTDNFIFNDRGDISGFDEVRTWLVTATNTRDLAIELEITRGFGTNYWDLAMVDPASAAADAVNYEKHDVNHARFKMGLKARGVKTFGYTVRTYHGDRERAWRQ